MSFAQEIKDFLDAYDTVSTVMTNQDRTAILRRQADIDERYKEALIRRSDWETGKEGRENDAIVESVDDPYSPFRTSSPSGGGDTGDTADGVTNTDLVASYSSGSYNAPALEQAFADTESFGGDWGAIGPPTKYGRAYGKYQVLKPNVGPWTEAYYGQRLSPEEFLANKDAQQAVFHGEMGRMVAKYGNLQDAMSEWFTGDDYATAVARNANDKHMGVVEYVDDVTKAYAKYASLSPEGAVAALPGVETEATELLTPDEFVIDEGDVDIDTMTGPGQPQEHDPYAKDDMLAEAGLTGPTEVLPEVIEQSVSEAAGVPNTVPASAPPEPGVMEEAVPEQAQAMGIDPLPQTSGHMDVVSRAGSSDAMAGDAAMEAMGDADPEPKGFLRGVLAFGRKMFALPDGGAIDDDESPAAIAYDDGVGGAPTDLIERLEERVDPNRTLTNEARMLKVMSVIWNFKMRQGKPNEAYGSAFSIYQTYKVMRDKSLALSQAALEEATTPEELTEAVEMFTEAYSLVPDGEVISATPNEDGTFTITVKDAQTGEQKQENLVVDAKEIVSRIMNITPDQFDDLVEEQILGADAVEPGMPPPVPMQPEEGAIPETPLVPNEPVPSPDEAIETAPPMGETVIPPDQSRVPMLADEGIQVASADANAPVTNHPAVTTPPVPRYASPIETQPGKPLNARDYEAWKLDPKNKIDPNMIPYMDSQWEKATARYNDWLKGQPTAESVAQQEAYNSFWTDLEAAPVGEYVNPGDPRIGAMGGGEASTAMARAVQQHNDEYQRLKTEEAASLETAEEQTSQSILEERLGAIPTENEFYSPRQTIPRGAQTYADRGTMFSGEPGEAEQSQVSGRIPVRGPDVSMPRGNEMLGINREDRAILQGEVDQANTDIAKWNEAFTGTEAPVPSESEDLVRQRLTQAYADHLAALQDPNRTPDAEAQGYLTWLADKVNREGMGSDVLQTARDLLAMPVVPGIARPSETRAVEIAYELLMFDKDNPTETLYDAERVTPGGEVPAGLVKVTNLVDPKSPFIIPEATFLMMDERRQILADTYIQEQEITQRQTNEATAAQNRTDVKNKALGEQMDNPAEQPEIGIGPGPVIDEEVVDPIWGNSPTLQGR